MFHQATVVDASYLNRRYQQLGIIGKGRDFIYDIQSTIHLIRERSGTEGVDQQKDDGKGKKFALQIYHSLSPDLYFKKVNQLQQAMTEYVTNYHTRIILLANRKINEGAFDLYVVYEADNLLKKSLEQEIQERIKKNQMFNEQEAKDLIKFFAKNITIAGRYTYEFLDITPKNVFLNTENVAGYGDYVITNFGLSMKGTKFYRRYTCPTDPFFKEPLSQKSVPQVIYNYTFQAAIVVAQAMLGFDTKDFYTKEEGTFKELRLNLLLECLAELKISPKLLGQIPSINRSKEEKKQGDGEGEGEQDGEGEGEGEGEGQGEGEEGEKGNETKKKDDKVPLPFQKNKITKPFVNQLKQLLAVDFSKRAQFIQMITYQQNEVPKEQEEEEQDKQKYLGGKHPWLIKGYVDEKNQGVYTGMGEGSIEQEEEEKKEDPAKVRLSQRPQKAIPDGAGQAKYDKENNRYGVWDQGKQTGFGCLELKGKNIFVTGKFTDGKCTEDQIIYCLGKWVYFGKLNEENKPDGEGRIIYAQHITSQKRKMKISIFFQGTFKEGQKHKGKQFYQDFNNFDGDFIDELPANGLMTYKEEGHTFQGTFQGGRRIHGILTFSDKRKFEGKFENDFIREGVLTYPDGATYQGAFREQQRCKQNIIYEFFIAGFGVYTYAQTGVRYEGTFEKNLMSGKGKIIDDKTEIEVVYEKGKLKTDIPPEIQKKIVKQKLVEQEKKEEIPEKIEGENDGNEEDNEVQNNEDVPKDKEDEVEDQGEDQGEEDQGEGQGEGQGEEEDQQEGGEGEGEGEGEG